jgi:hypothetical protein
MHPALSLHSMSHCITVNGVCVFLNTDARQYTLSARSDSACYLHAAQALNMSASVCKRATTPNDMLKVVITSWSSRRHPRSWNARGNPRPPNRSSSDKCSDHQLQAKRRRNISRASFCLLGVRQQPALPLSRSGCCNRAHPRNCHPHPHPRTATNPAHPRNCHPPIASTSHLA